MIITAVVLEGRSQVDVAREYGVSKSWVSKLVARYRTDGDAAFTPRSRRPRTSPNKTPDTTLELIAKIRAELGAQGLDAGTDTIVWHLKHHHQIVVSTSTVHRHLRAAGLVTPEPNKRPKSSYVRFEADQPNETWQSDFTHYRLANDVDVEIITWLDDHSRYALSVTAHLRITGTIVLTTFRAAYNVHGKPASTLTDNGMVYTTRFAGGTGGRNTFETELVNERIVQKNSRPNHPTTCGKVERSNKPSNTGSEPNPNPLPPANSKHSSTPSPTPTTTIGRTAHCHTEQHQPRSTPPDPKPRPATPATTPTTASDTTESAKPATSPSATTADSTTSASTNNSPEPTSSRSSTTSTSASSTPPPAKHSATSPSTPPATTNPPADHPDHPQNQNSRTRIKQVREFPISREIALVAGAGFEPATFGL